VADQRD